MKSGEESDLKTPPPPPPFAPPPLEDRSKYEKLFSVDCSDVDEEAVEKVEKDEEQPKDSDSIGSATDLKHYGSEDDATLQKYHVFLFEI